MMRRMVLSWMYLFLDTPTARWASGQAFWSEITRTAVSSARGEDGQFVTLLPATGDPWLKMQAVPGDRASVHLDLDSADREPRIRQSYDLGATFAWRYHDVTVLRSPGGLLFCHTRAREDTTPRLARDGTAVADQVCIDIPPRLWDTEVRFWCELTGRALHPGRRPEFAVLRDPDPAGPPRILLQRLDDDTPEVTAHLDLATADRAGDTRRHEALGARTVRVCTQWTVMRAPSGHVYCLTDRSPCTGAVIEPMGV